MNIVYFGSPDFSAEILHSLKGVVAVVTQPDARIGRAKVLTPSPVALEAGKRDLPVFKPEKLDAANLVHIKLLKPDLFLVVSYGQIIPEDWLNTPKLGTYNIHFSLLPKYRGALPISEAIKNQEPETGVTLIKMDTKLDHGPVIAQEIIYIDINDDVASLTKKLTRAAIDLLEHNLPPKDGTPQDDSLATSTPSFKARIRNNAYIPYDQIENALKGNNGPAIHALIRSLNPEPGAWTKINGLELKIIKTGLSGNLLTLEQVQLPGKKPVTWKQFQVGH